MRGAAAAVIKNLNLGRLVLNEVLIVDKPKTVVLLAVLFLATSISVAAEKCDSLQTAPPDRLVSYLNGIVRGTVLDRETGGCIVFAIRKLGNERYAPSIPVLTKFLDLHWPMSLEERRQRQRPFCLPEQRRADGYPATTALAELGTKSVPSVLEASKADSTSMRGRENAGAVLMEVYNNEPKQGLALLKQETDKNIDPAIKQRLSFAIYKALSWCNPSDRAQCREAAKTGYSN